MYTEIMELFEDTEPIGTATDEAENKESNEFLNDAMTEDFYDITHELIFDTDSSDEESDDSSLKYL
ncbi:3245_t:CDS:2 [Gigaspora rosea]|nr:3245_t:CDS:2 [Gigaspora rosea]